LFKQRPEAAKVAPAPGSPPEGSLPVPRRAKNGQPKTTSDREVRGKRAEMLSTVTENIFFWLTFDSTEPLAAEFQRKSGTMFESYQQNNFKLQTLANFPRAYYDLVWKIASNEFDM